MTVRVEKDGPVTTVILDRPDRKNAVDRAHAERLADAFRAFEADEHERSVRLAHIAHEKFDTTATAVPTALDRDVSLFSSWLDTVACRASGFVQSVETLRAAGESALAGETHAASESYETATAQFDRAFDCERESA